MEAREKSWKAFQANPEWHKARDASDTTDFLSVLQKILLGFGLVALFVGAFVIANSLSITIAQRTREFATLRTIGASRSQILRAVIIEAIAVGVLASVVGLFLGLGLAKGLFKLFDAAGLTLPNNGLTLSANDEIGVSEFIISCASTRNRSCHA